MRSHLTLGMVLLTIFTSSWALAQSAMGHPQRGGMIYADLCLSCHGDRLDGSGPEASFLRVRPADLKSLSTRIKSDWELLVIIGNGVMFTPMHGFRDIVNEREARDLLAYIRTEGPFQPL